jgi:hypothetical protein
MKLFTKKLFRLVLIEGILWGMTIAFGLTSVATAAYDRKDTFVCGLEFLLFIITFVACLGVNAWAIHVEESLEEVNSKINQTP